MVIASDKPASELLPNFQQPDSQGELDSGSFARNSEISSQDILIQPSSSTDTASEQATGILLVSLPDSFDDYQTPPEQPFNSQNSSNDGHVVATKVTNVGEDGSLAVNEDGEGYGQRVVDLANDEDNLDTEEIDVDDRVDEIDGGKEVTEVVETELVGSFEESRHREMVEMDRMEQESGINEKRKLPVSVTTHKLNNCYSRNVDFVDLLQRALKMVGEMKERDGGGIDDDGDDDFLETAMKRGLTLPRPRWWPEEGSENGFRG